MNHDYPGKLIVFEGIDGSGKSTQIKLLHDWLAKNSQVTNSRKVVATKQPYYPETRVALESDNDPLTELFLFMVDRSKHVNQVIIPALAQGSIVLCDRYTYSTVVYQGYCKNIDLDLINQLNRVATSNIKPDLMLWLYVEKYISISRIKQRNEAEIISNYEHGKIYRAYNKLFDNVPEKFTKEFVTLNANYPIEDVQKIIQKVIHNFLSSNHNNQADVINNG